jgi:cyclic beta-1,2-glucan synthetase
MEIRYLANRDPNLYFALVTDSPDSDQLNDERDRLVDVCRDLIEGLNRQYQSEGRSPLFMLHRHRAYNECEGRWMGWERKRGKLLDLNQLLRGGFDAFPVKVGDLPVLPRVRYVITLDSDTQLPRDSAAKLIGTLAHPLNQAVVDPASRMVVEGYGILQPRIGISIQSASRSRLAALYSGQTGFDIYTRAVSDVYQDLFGEGIFTGKGIYEVDALNEVLHQRFPDNALLSHDLIEGAYARVALVSDIELIDDYPSHFSAYSRRKHRWVRGDWQILRWVQARVPDYHGSLIPNPIPVISHWKIVDNLRRSLLEPSLVLLFLGAWFYLPGPPWFWTLATVLLLFIPAYWGILFALGRAPRGPRALVIWARDTARAFVKGNLSALLSLVFLFHQALLSIDAIVRSMLRVFITGRRLLEWETAAEAESAAGRKATVDTYLEWTPWIAIVIAAALWFTRPDSFPAAAPVLALWFASRAISRWLNRRPRTKNCELSSADKQFLGDSAERIYRYFHDWSSEASNWLIPDSVREDGAAELRLSPTNLAMLLNARVAAVHLGLCSVAEFAYQTRQTLDRVAALPKHRGHLYNWYDILTLQPMPPRFVSTVDSGNLAASLWTLKQAALAFAADPHNRNDMTAEMADDLRGVAETCETLVREMDFKFLYQLRKKALSVGYDASSDRLEPSCYDLLASEARIAVFIAIAKGDIPQEAWFHLGRAHTLFRGERILLSWTGTMFEYLMPVLWMKQYPGTILDRSMKSVVRAQREYARRKGVPWGISECGCMGETQCGYGYAPFGIPDIAMKRATAAKLVISPYSSFLAACVDPAPAIHNLRRMETYDWKGRYGFYEAIDYSRAGGEVVRSWMAHHQGMSLLAIVNLLFDNPMQRYFHSEPHVLATELLLHERVPAASLAEPDAPPLPALALAPA